MYAQYQSKGLVFYRIDSKESADTVRKFLEKESLHVPVLLDPSGRVERLFGVWVHPTSYLINRQGKASHRIMGILDWTNLQTTSLIDHLLQER
jgi:peroxiredoxin